MSGIQEVLLIVLLILALFLLPRIISSKRQPAAATPLRAGRVWISGKFRLALLASVVWLVVISIIFAPWRGQWLTFLYAGLGPLLFVWGIYWVVCGFRNYRQH